MPEVEGHQMSDFEFRFRELERRMARVEQLTDQIPVLVENMKGVREDLGEVKDEQRNTRRALYTAAISIASSSILFVYGVTELFR